MAKKSSSSSLESLKNASLLAAFLLVVWGFYRLIFRLPEEIEELFIKPVVWLLPVFYFLRKEGKGISSLGFTLKNLFPAVYFSLGLGFIFIFESLLINYLKYGSFNFAANIGDKPFFTALFLSFATAFSEEVAFRGYLFNRVWSALKNEALANISTSLIWALIHVPVVVFVWKLDFSASILYLFLTTIFGIGSAFVFARTKNIVSSILLHVLWEWPLILFR
jgi:membrane protease YdiL (CAAX protease family)